MRPYIIRFGKHRSGINFKPLFNPTEMLCNVMFTRGCIYDMGQEDQGSINTLVGFSRGHHLHNSVQIGWNSKDGKIRLYAYVYNKGSRFSEYIGEVSVDTPINISMKLINGKYLIKVLGRELTKSVSIPIDNPTSLSSLIGYKLFPQLGGAKTAPHDIIIWMS